MNLLQHQFNHLNSAIIAVDLLAAKYLVGGLQVLGPWWPRVGHFMFANVAFLQAWSPKMPKPHQKSTKMGQRGAGNARLAHYFPKMVPKKHFAAACGHCGKPRWGTCQSRASWPKTCLHLSLESLIHYCWTPKNSSMSACCCK